ncbi:hypothetical protein K438DRAFT_1782326 [Mycena galopus ATCC 62051]|nr:hypothetical protein K438DRAFT_1782326 [Mycena galopus ATCC 62051]
METPDPRVPQDSTQTLYWVAGTEFCLGMRVRVDTTSSIVITTLPVVSAPPKFHDLCQYETLLAPRCNFKGIILSGASQNLKMLEPRILPMLDFRIPGLRIQSESYSRSIVLISAGVRQLEAEHLAPGPPVDARGPGECCRTIFGPRTHVSVRTLPRRSGNV